MSDFRTSESHPLRIDVITVPGTNGRIGMTLCPGRSDDQSFNGLRWRRDLAMDLETIRKMNPCLLLTLNEPHEFPNLGVPEFETVLGASNLPWRILSIPDGGVPGPAFDAGWQSVGSEARRCLKGGRLVVIHCRAGLGRTGMIAALLLIELGILPSDAVTTVRNRRSLSAIERNQEQYLLKLKQVANESPS